MKLADQDGFYKRRLKGLLSVLCSYWLILLVFSVISIMTGQGDFMPGSIQKFVLNALTLENSYNGAWWYMFTYAVLVLISPVVVNWVKKCHPIIVLGTGFMIYCTAYYVRFKVNTGNLLLLKFGPTGMTFFEYLLGAMAWKYRIFTKLYGIWKKIPNVLRGLLAVAAVIGMLYVRTRIVPTLFVAPVSGFVVMTLFHFWIKPKWVQSIFQFVGKHSTNIWLTHMFFYLVLFKNFVYIAKYPLLVYAFMMAITISLSIGLQCLERPIQKRIAQI